MIRRSIQCLSFVVVVAIATTGCGSTNPAPSPSVQAQSNPRKPVPASSPSSEPTGVPAGAPATIPQPPTPAGIKTAPESARIDLVMPTFSNPTNITNPLFPVSKQASVLMLGHVDGKPFRTEVTLLPFTHVIDWGGQQIETAVSQYCAYLDGRITELAYDLYAQADDGSVWYFGEDVFDFTDGHIVTTEGTWQAGRDGPAAMIMPGHPKVGDVYRTENAPGFVFEQVTIKAVDRPLRGPLGSIVGGLSALELHADGATEDKLFAPGYGEFRTTDAGDLEALALAVPTDAQSGPVPPEVRALADRAMHAFDEIGAGGWATARRDVAALERAWGQVKTGTVPTLVAGVMERNLRVLARAVQRRGIQSGRTAAIDVARSSYDLQLLSTPQTVIDLHRFDLWAAQLQVDVAAHDNAGMGADIFALDYIRDRFIQTLDTTRSARLNTLMNDLQVAVEGPDIGTIRSSASELRALVAKLIP